MAQRPVYDGEALHRKLAAALGLSPFDAGIYTRIAKDIGEYQSGYNRAVRHSNALLRRIGKWCDRVSMHFVWDNGVHFIDPCEAFIYVPGTGETVVQEGDAYLVRGDGTVIRLSEREAARLEAA